MTAPPTTPITTCTAQQCDGCGVSSEVHCHFHLKDTIRFWSIALPPLLLGTLAAYNLGWVWLVIFLLMILGYFGFLEIWVMCSHCPHYAEPGSTLSCWANYGSPKLWAYRPGPMSRLEHVLFISGLSAVYGFPLVCFVIGGQWFLLLIYALSAAGFLVTLRTFFCSACMNFACTLNTVGEAVRQDFFSKNPQAAQGWGLASPPDAARTDSDT